MITPLPYWNFNPVLPTVFDDSLSYLEMVSKLYKKLEETIALFDLPHQQLDALQCDLFTGLDDGGHHRHAVTGHRDAVEADDRYILRHPEPGAHQRPDGTESDDIAHGEQSGELGPAGQQDVYKRQSLQAPAVHGGCRAAALPERSRLLYRMRW